MVYEMFKKKNWLNSSTNVIAFVHLTQVVTLIALEILMHCVLNRDSLYNGPAGGSKRSKIYVPFYAQQALSPTTARERLDFSLAPPVFRNASTIQ